MEISGASSSAYQSAYDRPVAIKSADAGSDDARDVSNATSDTVDISPQAARAYEADAGREGGEAEAEADAHKDADASPASKEAAAENSPAKAAEKEKPSDSKSFVYGALGLERPEMREHKSVDGYDFGRWVAAGVTVGTIISVLV